MNAQATDRFLLQVLASGPRRLSSPDQRQLKCAMKGASLPPNPESERTGEVLGRYYRRDLS